MIYVFYSIHVIVSLFLILVVLLQQGKGADLSVFGGGSTQTAFGARGAATLLHKLTVVSFILFILTTLSIAVYQIGGPGGRSVVGEEEAAEEAAPAAGEPEGGSAGEAGATLPAEAPPVPATEAPAEPAEPAGEGAATATEGAAEPPPAPGGDGGR